MEFEQLGFLVFGWGSQYSPLPPVINRVQRYLVRCVILASFNYSFLVLGSSDIACIWIYVHSD